MLNGRMTTTTTSGIDRAVDVGGRTRFGLFSLGALMIFSKRHTSEV